jgi:hypothetical protein
MDCFYGFYPSLRGPLRLALRTPVIYRRDKRTDKTFPFGGPDFPFFTSLQQSMAILQVTGGLGIARIDHELLLIDEFKTPKYIELSSCRPIHKIIRCAGKHAYISLYWWLQIAIPNDQCPDSLARLQFYDTSGHIIKKLALVTRK